MRAFGFGLGLLLLTIPAASPAQPDSLGTTPLPPDTLRIYSNIFTISGYRYKYGDLKGDVGIGAGDVKKIVSGNPRALEETRTFAKYQIPSFALGIFSIFTLIGGAASGDGAVIAIGAGGLVTSIVLDGIGYSHLKKGARLFNADLPRPDALGVERPDTGPRWITVTLKSGRTIVARKVAPHGLGVVRIDPAEGEAEFHDGSQIQSIGNGYGQDVTAQVLDRGSTITAP